MQTILDFHAHIYPDKIAGKAVGFLNSYYGVRCEGDGTMADLKAAAEAAGVRYLLVHSAATKPEQVESVNNFIASQLSGTVLGFGTMHPGYPHIRAEMERLRSLGLRGLKLHPDFQNFYVDSPEMDEVYAAAEELRLPVLLHAGDRKTELSSPERIVNVVERFPGLTVIAAHLGGFAQWDLARRTLIGKNVYIDTSSSLWFIPPEQAVETIRAHGTDRVLFGTDYPLRKATEEIAKFESLGLTEEEKRKIYFENAQRLLGL